MGVDPREFGTLDPDIVRAMMEGWKKRDEYLAEMLAMHAAWICTAVTGKRITARKLLGRDHQSPDQIFDMVKARQEGREPGGDRTAALDEKFEEAWSRHERQRAEADAAQYDYGEPIEGFE